MVRSNYQKPNKFFVGQVDKTLDILILKQNIKSGFKVIGI